MFINVKKQVQDNLTDMLSKSNELFYVSIDREVIWENYLEAFEEATKQEHNCNCCKSFLRQYGGIVAIIGGKKVSIWDNMENVPEDYKVSIMNLSNYIHSLPITDVFLNEFAKCGTNRNLDPVREVTWEHFYIELPAKFVNNRDIDSIRGSLRTNQQTLARSLKELTLDAVETVLDLIAQNSLYRGNEFLNIIKAFQTVKIEYDLLIKENYFPNKEVNFTWLLSKLNPSLCSVRNSAIGTLLINLSEGMPLDVAVGKFESVVAPSNYKRPTALVTPKMVESAKEKLIELGLIDSLERRLAVETDLNVEDILYTDKSSVISDVFGEMSKDNIVNPKTFSKVEEISIKDFIDKVLPTTKSLEVLLERPHFSNLVTLVTGENKEGKSLFKWDNLFSWAYSGGITDSMKERVKSAGGKVDGVLRYSIQWNEDGNNNIDFDAHAYEPNGTHINFSDYRGSKTPMSGMLDVDVVRPGGKIAVENITWSDLSKMKEGDYKFVLNNYSSNRSDSGFKAEIEFNGEIHEFEYNKVIPGRANIDVAIVTYSKTTGFTIKSLLDSKSSVSSDEKWKVKTNQFTKVNKVMLSPNHWGANTGNKHFMFFLDRCVSDEETRPFFNEFLKEEFNENRKVFEIMGSKMKVQPNDNQLSGVGFSETQKNHLLVRVDGTFKRVLKINF